MARLSGRTALITGASRGIGAAIAQRFAAEGAKVVITARTLRQHDHLEGNLEETLAAIHASGGEGHAIVADLCDAEDRRRLLEEAERKFGAIDILINNAAANFFLPLDKVSDKRWQIMFEMNVKAPFDLARGVVEGMRRRGAGWIVNVSTASAEHPVGPPFSHHDTHNHPMLYGASKAALNRLTSGLAAELHADGIRVNSVAPVGAVATPGAVALNMLPPERDMIEGLEVMAEAALWLADCPADYSGHITYSGSLLKEQGATVRTLDGGAVYDGYIEGVDEPR